MKAKINPLTGMFDLVEEERKLFISSGGGGTTTGGAQTYDEYIYNSSGAQSGNRYNDWSDLMAEIDGGQEGPTRITFEQNEVLPAGTWNLDYVTFAGDGRIASLGGLVVTIPAGFILGGSGYWRNGRLTSGVGISYTGASTLITAPAGVSTFALEFGDVISCTTASFFSVPSGAVYIIALEFGSSLLNSGYEPVTIATGGANYVTIGSSSAQVGNDIFRGTVDPGSGILLIDSPAGSTLPTRTDANLSGTYSMVLASKAYNVSFDNTTNGFTATDVQAAIEEAAAGGGGAVSSVFGRTGAVTAATSDYDASQIDNTPAGTISATDVQGALNELDNDLSGKVSKSGDSMTGALSISTTDNNLNISRPVDTNRSIVNFTTNGSSAWRVGKYGNGGSDESFYIHKSGGGDPIMINHTTEAITINGDYTLPTTDGSANYVLTTDGSGNVTWQPGGSGATGYTWENYEKTGTYVYVGYENASTSHWYIYRRTIATNARQYATGTSSYSTNWTGRAGLTYV